MRLGQSGRDLIQGYEKLRLIAYRDSGGVLTIGWGHTSAAGGLQVRAGMQITHEQADEEFERDTDRYAARVDRLVTVDLAQHEFDALVSFEYNTGALAHSTLLKKLNAGDKKSVPGEMMKWTHCGGKELLGLVRRRRAEAALFLDSGHPVSDTESRDASAMPDRPKARSMATSKIGNSAIVVGASGALEGVRQASGLLEQVTSQVSTTVHSVQDTITYPPLTQAVNVFVKHPTLVLPVVIVIAAIAIWLWRAQDFRETGA